MKMTESTSILNESVRAGGHEEEKERLGERGWSRGKGSRGQGSVVCDVWKAVLTSSQPAAYALRPHGCKDVQC